MDYKWHGDIPKDVDEQEFLDAKSDTLKAEILRKLYREAVVPQPVLKSSLESEDLDTQCTKRIIYTLPFVCFLLRKYTGVPKKFK